MRNSLSNFYKRLSGQASEEEAPNYTWKEIVWLLPEVLGVLLFVAGSVAFLFKG